MNLKQIVKNKKVKNIIITVCEILIVAGIIFGALMFIYSKINKDASQIGGVYQDSENSETQKEDESSDEYYIEVNIKKNAMIVYQYSKDKKSKTPYKVFPCSIGSDVKKGKYKTSESYSWIQVNGGWHKYNTQFDAGSWIQSAEYTDKYDNTLNKKSYKSIGKKQKSGSCIMLYARDAAWIYDNCKNETEIRIVAGKKSDKLPLDSEKVVSTAKYCGWDPTDPDKNNPYKKISNEKIVCGLSTVTVEKGEEPDYLSNILARDENGKNIAGLLKYKKIDTDETGTYKVKYTYKTKTGKKLEIVQKFQIVDTTCPVVTCSQKLFTYEVKSRDTQDLNKESNVKDIEKMVRAKVSCNESDVTITVSCVSASELKEGKVPVVIKAQDKAGNVGSCQVMCEITIKKVQGAKKYQPTEKQKSKAKTKVKETEKTTTKSKKKSEKTTKKSSEETTEETTTANE